MTTTTREDLKGRRVLTRVSADTTNGPAPAGSVGHILAGRPARERPRGHPARLVQVHIDTTGGWVALDVDDVEMLAAGAPTPPPLPTTTQGLRLALLDARRQLAEADAVHRECIDEIGQLRARLAAASAAPAAPRAE
jgi:hypothetical protein